MRFAPLNFIRETLSPGYLGIDIGTTSIKAVEIERGEKLPRLKNYAFLEAKDSFSRANVALQTSSLKMFDEQVEGLLGLLLEKMKPGTRQAVASLPGFSAFMTVLNFPEMSLSDLEKAVLFEAKQYIPLPLSEVALDWTKVGSYEDEKGFRFDQVLLISVPQEMIKKYQKIFERAGLTLKALELESLSLVRSLIHTDPTPTAILDIGNRATTIVLAREGQLKFSAQSDFGGSSLTQAVAQSLNISPQRAEELKREKGIAGTGPSYELSTIMLPFLDAILSEVKRAEANYEVQFPGTPKFERVILSGGGANLVGIEKYAAQFFGVPAMKAAPLLAFEYSPILEPLISELNPLLAVGLGVGLRELSL